MTLAEVVAALYAAVAGHAHGGYGWRTPHGGGARQETTSIVADARDPCVITVAVRSTNYFSDRGPQSGYRNRRSRWESTMRWRVPLAELRAIDVNEDDNREGGAPRVEARARGKLSWELDPPPIGANEVGSGVDTKLDFLVDDKKGGRRIAVAWERAVAACAKRRAR